MACQNMANPLINGSDANINATVQFLFVKNLI